MDNIEFPIDTQKIIKGMPNCAYLSYQDFARINNCSVSTVIHTCNSKDGCSHYDVANNRYLIMCNQSTENYNTPERQRWTCAHEIGHIVCGHHKIAAVNTADEINYESEADLFAAILLAPFPLYNTFGISTPLDIKNIFGLSFKAAQNRYNDYIKWANNHIKTAWENDLVHLYNYKRYINELYQ